MLKPKSLMLGTSAALIAAGMAGGPAHAQFYKGKTLKVIINYGAGGNTDIQGRSVLRYMQNHIPGNPRIVVKNMPGAGGAVATNYLGEAAKRDGSTIGIFTIAFSAALVFLEPANDVAWANEALPLLGVGPVVPLWVSLAVADWAVKLGLALVALLPFRVIVQMLTARVA